MVKRRRQRSKPWPRGRIAKRRAKRPFKSHAPGSVTTIDGVVTFLVPRKVTSMNRIRTGLARHSDTKAWERALASSAVIIDDGTVRLPVECRMRCEIVRYAPNERYLLDQTNLAGGVKGLEDALVRLGYLVDDTIKWEDGPHCRQDIAPDKHYWTRIILTAAK